VKSAVLRLLAASLLAAGLGLLGAPAGAASEAPPNGCQPTAAEAVESAEAVFTGVVTQVGRANRGGGDVLFGNEVRVELVFKGAIDAEAVTVVTRPSNRRSTGLGALQSGQRYLFFVRALEADAPVYVAGGCSGTAVAVADQVTRVEELLGAGESPVPPEMPTAELTKVDDSDPVDFTRSAAPGLALVLIGLLGLVVVGRLGRRS
jgi:hypothetical protein